MKFCSFNLFNWSCQSSKNIHASSVTAHFEQTVVNTSLLLTLSNQELDDCLFLLHIMLESIVVCHLLSDYWKMFENDQGLH